MTRMTPPPSRDHRQGTPASAGDGERYRSLLEITNALIANLTQEGLFHAIAQALRRVVPFDRTAIFLHEPQRDVLRLFILESSLPTTYFVVGLEMPAGLPGYRVFSVLVPPGQRLGPIRNPPALDDALARGDGADRPGDEDR